MNLRRRDGVVAVALPLDVFGQIEVAGPCGKRSLGNARVVVVAQRGDDRVAAGQRDVLWHCSHDIPNPAATWDGLAVRW